MPGENNIRNKEIDGQPTHQTTQDREFHGYAKGTKIVKILTVTLMEIEKERQKN